MDDTLSPAPAAAPGPELSAAQHAALAVRIEDLLARSPQRIHKLRGGAEFPELPEGATVWLKRAEPPHPSALVRLYNLAMTPVPLLRSVPNPGGSAALDNERRRLQVLAAQGVPVPALVAYGRHWIATANAGTEPLQARLDRLQTDPNLSLIHI